MKTKTISTYRAIRAAANALGIDRRYIYHYVNLKQEKPVLGRYTFEIISSNSQNLDFLIKPQKFSTKLEVTNVDTNITTTYLSISAAARALNLRQASISAYLIKNSFKPYKGKYLFKKV